MINCPKCGLTITDAQEECPKCRTKLKDIKNELKKVKSDMGERKEFRGRSVAEETSEEKVGDELPKREKDEVVHAKLPESEKEEESSVKLSESEEEEESSVKLPESEKDEMAHAKASESEKDEMNHSATQEGSETFPAAKKTTMSLKEEILAATANTNGPSSGVEDEVLVATEMKAVVTKKKKKKKKSIKSPVKAENLCEICMTPVNDGQKFCQSCDLPVESVEEIAKPVQAEKFAKAVQPVQIEKNAKAVQTAEDVKLVQPVKLVHPVQDIKPLQSAQPVRPKPVGAFSKFIAALGYIVFFFPLLCGGYQKSSFAKFHAKQATLLFIASAILFVGLIWFRSLLSRLFPTESIAWHRGYWAISSFYLYLRGMIYALHLMPFALMIVGMISSAWGKKRRLPVIGRFVEDGVEIVDERI